MSNENRDGTLILATVNAEGTPPANRIANAQALYAAYWEAVQMDQRNDLRFAAIRGCYDGFPPLDPGELESQGLKDAPNINLKQMQSKVNTYVDTWTQHNTGGDQWFDVQCKPEHAVLGGSYDARMWSNWNKDLTKFFNEAIKDWDADGSHNASEFIFRSMVRDTQMGLFGIGIAYYSDPIDWRWKTIPTREVRVPDGTYLSLENCEALFVERKMTVAQLYNLVKDEKKDSPWNRDAVMRALYLKTAQRTANMGPLETFAMWENRVRNNRTWLACCFTQILMVDAYIAEFDIGNEKDGISHYVILRDANNTDFMYEKSREYRSFHDIIVPFVDNAGPEGDWHGVKGFGDLVYDGCHFNNMLFNQVALGAIMTTLPMFQSSTEGDQQKLNQISMSRMGILFPGLDIAQLNLQVDLNGGMGVLGESNRVLNENSRIYPINDVDRRGGEKTATQALIDRQDQTQFTNGQIKLYRITGADRLGWTMYKRLSRPAREYPEAWPGGKQAAAFRKKCKDAGIPEKCYSDVMLVQASRSGGTGNMSLDATRADQAMMVATPGPGQMAARREKIAALYGRERVSEFIQEEPEPTPELQKVGYENCLLNDGKIFPAYPWDAVEVHLGAPSMDGTGHLAVAMAAQQAATAMSVDKAVLAQNLDDAQKLNGIIEATFSHIAMHLQFMAQVPLFKDQVQGLSKFLKDLQSFHQAFGTDVARAMQEAQPQNGMTPEQIKAVADARVQAQVTMMKAQADIQANLLKTLARIDQQAATSESRHRAKEITAATDAILKQKKADVELGIEAETEMAKRQIEMMSAARPKPQPSSNGNGSGGSNGQ